MGLGLGDRFRSFFSDVPAQRKEAKEFSRQESSRIRAALGELTPEAINNLMQLFYGKFFRQMAPQMQFATQRLKAGAARTGMTRAGLTEQLAAGIPGQFSQNALAQAYGASAPIASQRAGIRAGRKIAIQPARSRAKHDLLNTFMQFYTGGNTGGGTQSNQYIYG